MGLTCTEKRIWGIWYFVVVGKEGAVSGSPKWIPQSHRGTGIMGDMGWKNGKGDIMKNGLRKLVIVPKK